MKFDIKDVKSWANRHDVKVGDEGYLSADISTLRGQKDAEPTKLDHIFDNKASCFSSLEYFADYPFFLPLNAVEKEKKYRPFKDLYEFYKFLSISPFTKKEFCNELLLKFSFTYREKILPQIVSSVVITRIDVGSDNDPCSTFINRKDLEDWFDNYEIMNSKGEWLPFGVETKEDD
nr:MAG TPA: nucleoid-associated protein [Caudoviricetes sp.]